MDTEGLLASLTREDLQAILRCNNDSSSGSKDELMMRVLRRHGGIPWKVLLNCVPKDSLQRICGDHGLRTDLSKDELIDQIAGLRSRPPGRGDLLRGLWTKWRR
ncbi:MAG: hypothetical protein ISF22_00325 [Methanomassiliicoccus sp.]|nr:hypothetical protein [Methanomassiliicoccus sp.]